MKRFSAVLSGLLSTSAAFASHAHPAMAHHPSISSQFMSTLPMMLGIVAIFYFMLIRPQNKRNKEQRDLLGALAPGDEVVTTGGIVAKISRLQEEHVVLRTNKEQTLLLRKTSVASVLPKGTWESLQSQ